MNNKETCINEWQPLRVKSSIILLKDEEGEYTKVLGKCICNKCGVIKLRKYYKGGDQNGRIVK